MGSGVDKYKVEYTVYDLLIDEIPLDKVMETETTGNYHLVAANYDVTAAEVKLMSLFAREMRLHNALENYKDNYDYILIDCPPSLNTLTVNAMAAADSVLIPIQCEYYALEGLTALLDTIKKLSLSFLILFITSFSISISISTLSSLRNISPASARYALAPVDALS
jgi:chromosome partitioning protein